MGKYWRHFKTVCRHKFFVFRECRKCGITWQGFVHDLSKFSVTEFMSSAKYFQGDRSPIQAEKEAIGYSKAWLHHKSHNKHHWQYWTDFDTNGDIIKVKIPIKYVVEMVCDWIGAGKAYSTKKWSQIEPLDYYVNHIRKESHIHPETERTVMHLLLVLADKGPGEFHNEAKRLLRGNKDNNNEERND